jgi:uncharacterized protein YndB with AHSA1/START domain
MEVKKMQGNHQGTLPDIRKTAIFNAPIQKVWEFVSTAEGIAAWFMPNDFQQKIGHEFTIQTQFGPVPCKVLELDPPNRLSFAWDEFGWRVSFELKEIDGKTEFTLVHSGWGEPDELIPRVSQKHSVIRNIMDNGWESLVHEKLRKAVEA